MHDIGWFLLHVLWQDMLIAVMLAALLALVHERAATIRHAMSVVALALMLVLPLMTAFGQGPALGTLTAGQTMTGAGAGGVTYISAGDRCFRDCHGWNRGAAACVLRLSGLSEQARHVPLDGLLVRALLAFAVCVLTIRTRGCGLRVN